GVVAAVSAGVVTISYTVGGCSATHSITVNPAPSSISGPSTVVAGSTITLSDAVPGGTWLCSSTSIATISSAGVVTGVASGVVNIYYILGSCAAYKTVTVTPAPPGKISGKITTGGAKGTSGEMAVVGMNVELKDNTNITIAATSTNAEGDYSFEGLSDGGYIVYPGASGYTTTASAVINISSLSETASGINFRQDNSSMTISPVPTAVTAITYSSDISIFPNPASGYINIKWDGQATETANMIITDVVGREVLNTPVDINDASGQVQVSLSGLKNGLYIVTIKSANINISNRLMIQK
ncbi:MAG: surface protein, partial [Flavipsychrobacter sp.]|nr:surface protein [Flavipsychrobacter sp.]